MWPSGWRPWWRLTCTGCQSFKILIEKPPSDIPDPLFLAVCRSWALLRRGQVQSCAMCYGGVVLQKFCPAWGSRREKPLPSQSRYAMTLLDSSMGMYRFLPSQLSCNAVSFLSCTETLENALSVTKESMRLVMCFRFQFFNVLSCHAPRSSLTGFGCT